MNENEQPEHWDLRKAVKEDLPFIYSTWSQSYRYDSSIGKGCRNHIFHPHFLKVIDYILFQPDTGILVACSKDHSNVIFGYLVYQPEIIHYVYIKEVLTRHGLAKSLIKKGGEFKYFTHKTFSVHRIMRAHPELKFNPFLLYKQIEGEAYGVQTENKSA